MVRAHTPEARRITRQQRANKLNVKVVKPDRYLLMTDVVPWVSSVPRFHGADLLCLVQPLDELYLPGVIEVVRGDA